MLAIRAANSRSLTVRVHASIAAGAKVKVSTSVKVFHAPGAKDGLDLKGMSGTVVGRADVHDGKPTSANLPVKVEFKMEKDGKPAKFVTHMGEDELTVA